MPYSQFSLAQVEHDFGVTVGSADLFPNVPPEPLPPANAAVLAEHLPMALDQTTEKAKSELLVAPLLAVLWRKSDRKLAIYSGNELNVDPARGLVGVCDFLVTSPPMTYPVRPPVLAVVEAKRDDVKNGYGQCAAELVAALELNRRANTGRDTVFGCVTTGLEWKFLRLAGTRLDIDESLYLITDPARILGILMAICGFGPSPLHPRPDSK